MRSSKSRSRSNKNRNNNRPTGSNVINRVFDSSGPEGKVRGTPQQIIEKYLQLHRDAQLSGDRVNAENFAQHAEHYTRILAEAQREVDRAREEQEQFNRDRQAERDRERAQNQQNQGYQNRQRSQDDAAAIDPARMEQPDVMLPPMGDDLLPDDGESTLIDLPEGKPAFLDARPRQDRRPRGDQRQRGDQRDRQPRPEPVAAEAPQADAPAAEPAVEAAPEAAPQPAADKPARRPRSRKPRAEGAPEAASPEAAAPEAAE